ncbi:MAG: SpoIIE family protein phosphatase [Gammaproteobacteria bacterium]|nr:SpoIIE family protein phosphatase [Gammaproteobacteria bacterium]
MELQELKNESDKSCEQLELLTTVLQEFSTTLDIDATLQHVTSLVKKYLDAEGVSLFLLENGEQELVCKICSSEYNIVGSRLDKDDGIAGRSLRERKTQLIIDAPNDPDFYRGVDQESGMTTHSILCAPMLLKDVRIGVLEAVNKKTNKGLFDEHDKNLLTILANTAAMAIHNSRMAEDLVFQERTRRELELAREIQAALLPDNSGSLPIYGVNIPARMVSGDFYDYFSLDDGRIYFGIGDVAGKGINASLLMAKTTSLFRCLGKQVAAPGALLSIINRELCANSTRGIFVTMVAGIFDPLTNRVTMVNAGHNDPVFFDQKGEMSELKKGSIPLGVIPDAVFEEYQLNIKGGDLYIFTDGLSECWFERNQQLGEEGVKQVISQFAEVPARERLQDIVEYVTQWKREQTGYLYDDVTMLLVEGSRE